MKLLYYARVFFVGYEFLAVVSGLAVYLLWGDLLDRYFSTETLTEDAVKWGMLFPICISTWTLKEAFSIIFPGNSAERVLHEWPNYWKLKAHFDVGVLNSILYVIPCIVVWFTGGLIAFTGAWIFLIFTVALSLNALSFYSAKASVRSLLIRCNIDAQQ